MEVIPSGWSHCGMAGPNIGIRDGVEGNHTNTEAPRIAGFLSQDDQEYVAGGCTPACLEEWEREYEYTGAGGCKICSGKKHETPKLWATRLLQQWIDF